MATYLNGRFETERAHSPREASEVECKDCFSLVADADEEYCEKCGEPLCEECQVIFNDEPLCAKCFSALAEAALASLQRDPQIGDLFRRAA
jgi:formylmethanofuran dehydrogenase subunit E